ncbi:copper amine oxidase N-terminal domain-containing protein [Effusibacillus consociatus]
MLSKSSELIGKELKNAKTTEDVRNILAKYSTYQWTEAELQQILQGDGSSYGREGGLNAVVAKHALVGWTGHGHSGVDVGIWGYGPAIDALRGVHDNTDLAKVAAETIGVDLVEATKKLQAKYLYPLFKIDRAGKVLFPARALYAEYGLKTSWDAATQTATFEKEGLKIVATINQNTITVNGEKLTLPTALSEDNGTMYLPLEAFEKAVGKKLTWDSLSERIVME